MRRRVGLAAAVAVAAGTTALARRRSVAPAEEWTFRAVNELPRALVVPVYVVMQSGSLAAVYVVAGGAHFAGRRRVALTSALVGTTVWGGCKILKHWVGRGRPVDHITGTTIRGAAAKGLGFPSGHAAVAATLACLVAPSLPPAARGGAWAVALGAGIARMYVGAHLPLDVLGGTAIGLAAGLTADLFGKLE